MPGSTEPPAVRINRALALLKERGVLKDSCPRCNVFDWNVDINDIPANSAMAHWSPTAYPTQSRYSFNQEFGPYMSLLSIVCKNCGYTMFHNMNILEPRRK
jgi:hypothetical protein